MWLKVILTRWRISRSRKRNNVNDHQEMEIENLDQLLIRKWMLLKRKVKKPGLAKAIVIEN